MYLLLPLDGLEEYRFASPFFLFFYAYLVTLAWSLCAITMRHRTARRTFAIVLEGVAESYGHRYNRVAAALGLEAASLLTPDMGGTLLYSKLQSSTLAVSVTAPLRGLWARTKGRFTITSLPI